MNAAHGRNRTPVSNGVYPSTNWKYCVMMKIAPNIAKNTSITPLLAAVNRGFLKKCTSSIGWSMRLSHTKKTSIRSAPTTNAETIVLSPQPSTGASMMP